MSCGDHQANHRRHDKKALVEPKVYRLSGGFCDLPFLLFSARSFYSFLFLLVLLIPRADRHGRKRERDDDSLGLAPRTKLPGGISTEWPQPHVVKRTRTDGKEHKEIFYDLSLRGFWLSLIYVFPPAVGYLRHAKLM